VKLRDLAGISAFPGVTPIDSVVFSSGVSAIAQADVTKHAREISIVQPTGIASFSLSIPCRGKQIPVSHANDIGMVQECRSV